MYCNFLYEMVLVKASVVGVVLSKHNITLETLLKITLSGFFHVFVFLR